MSPDTFTSTTEETYVDEKLIPGETRYDHRNSNLQNLWHVLDVPVLIISRAGFVLASNPAARLLLKFGEIAVPHLPFSSMFLNNQKDEVITAIQMACEDRVATYEGTIISREKVGLPVEVVLKAGQWHERDVLFCFCHDLRIKDELEELVDRLQHQLNEAMGTASAFQWSMSTDSNGRIVLRQLSPSVSRVTGYGVEEVLTQFRDWLEIVHPEDRAFVEDQSNKRVKGRSRDPIEYRIIQQGGVTRWVQDSLEERRIVAGRVHLSGFVSDITDRRRAEELRQQSNDQLLQWVNELKQRSSEAVLLNEMGDLLQSSLTMEDIWMVVRRFAVELFHGQSGAVYLLGPNHNLLERVLEWGENPPEKHDFPPEDCWGLRRNRIVTGTGKNGVTCRHVPDRPGATSLCVPMTVQTETLGLFHLCGESELPLEYLTQTALMFASRIALALSNLRLSETLRQQSIRDPLTALYNRRYLEEMLSRELRRAARHDRPIGLIMADIDHFKDFNDQFGHAAGDVVLQEVARFLQTQIRGEDIICRYGGEEFIVILVEASLKDTEKRADLLRKGIEGLSLSYGDVTLGNVTVSFGVSGFPQHGKTMQTLIEAADTALYRAKQAGRNCVMSAD